MTSKANTSYMRAQNQKYLNVLNILKDVCVMIANYILDLLESMWMGLKNSKFLSHPCRVMQGESEKPMKKIDLKMLSYLTPATEAQLLKYGNDTYFCGCSKYLAWKYKDSCIEKVRAWVERNGGRFEEKSDWERINDKDGIFVQIIFPGYGKRNMKEIMSTLF